MIHKKKGGKIYNIFLKFFSRVEKRQRFIIATILLSFIVLGSTFFSFEEIIFFIPLIVLAVYGLTFFSILEGISRHEWLMLFLHPLYFTVAIYLFYFFLPQRWLTRLPFVIIYTIAIYAILLSQNIFNVGVSKSLQLSRAAFSVNYLFLTISSFISYSLILSLRANFLVNFGLIFLATFPLTLHFLWTISLDETINRTLISYSLVVSLILAELSALLSFVPVNQSIFALVLTSVFYSLNGLFQVYIQEVLFKERVREYLIVLGFSCVIFMLSLRW